MKFKKIITILILIIILIAIIVAYVIQNLDDDNTITNFDITKKYDSSNNSNSKEQKIENKTTISSNAEIKSALVEQIELHATYYLSEIYVEEGQFVNKDDNILKYKNGTYFKAPYDCVITTLKLPDINNKILNSHYVEVSSINLLSVTLNIDESKIGNLKVGNEAIIKVSTTDKTYTGYVTSISSIANNGKFKTTIEFENDGNIKLGMTANVEMTI